VLQKSIGKTTFSATVRVGSSWKNWKTTPTLRPRQIASCSCERAWTGVPAISTSPLVGRSTFYAHFLDKRELLLTGVAGLQELLTQPGAARDSSATVSERLLKFSLPLFQHVQGNIRFCRALLGPHNGAIVEPRIQHILADLVRKELAACIPSGVVPVVPLNVVVQYTVSAFLGLLRWWMGQPTPCAAEEIDQQFRTLTLPAITAALQIPAVAI
jgi:AcrR family transcriptional regulator